MDSGTDGETGAAGTDSGIGDLVDVDWTPGDGDGEPCEQPLFDCNYAGCWATHSEWTAEAHAVEQQTLDAAEMVGTWHPVDIGVGDACWELGGSGEHVCVSDVCGTLLIGRPADELDIEPSDGTCDFTGVWSSTATGFGVCFGIVDGIAVELRSPSPFAEIRCVDAGQIGDLCVGRPVGAASAWVIVASDDQINQLITDGDASPVDTWTDGCANGQHPDNFLPSYRCLWLTEHEASVCYSGDGKWWTQVDRCTDMGPDPAWASQQCNGQAGDVGPSPWDTVMCHDTESGSCMGAFGPDRMWVWPTCWVAMWPSLNQ